MNLQLLSTTILWSVLLISDTTVAARATSVEVEKKPEEGLQEAMVDSKAEAPDQSILDSYGEFLGGLPKDDPASISKGIGQYLIQIGDCNAATRDRAFLLFLDFHTQTCEALDKKVSEYVQARTQEFGKNYLFDRFWEEYPPSEVGRRLARHGLELHPNEEAWPEVRGIPPQIPAVFSPYVSRSLKCYLELRERELEEGFAADGGLLVSFKRLAERLGQWEDYLKRFPNSLVRADVIGIRNTSLNAMLGSCWNTTPEIRKGGEDIKSIYEQFVRDHPGTESADILTVFLKKYAEADWEYSYEIRKAALLAWNGTTDEDAIRADAWPAIQLYYRVVKAP